jgi:hypothetical protein
MQTKLIIVCKKTNNNKFGLDKNEKKVVGEVIAHYKNV